MSNKWITLNEHPAYEMNIKGQVRYKPTKRIKSIQYAGRYRKVVLQTQDKAIYLNIDIALKEYFGIQLPNSTIPDLPNEQWIVVPQKPHILVSNKGRIKTTAGHIEELILTKPNIEGRYLYGGIDFKLVIANAFVPNPHKRPYVTLKDKRKGLEADNLVWTDQSTLTRLAIKTGKLVIKSSKKHYLARPVYQYAGDSLKLLKTWDCMSDAARALGIHKSNIHAVCNNKCKRAGGFIWAYADEPKTQNA